MPDRILLDGEKYELQQLLDAPGKKSEKGTANGCEWQRVKEGSDTAWQVRNVGNATWASCSTSQDVVAWIGGGMPVGSTSARLGHW